MEGGEKGRKKRWKGREEGEKEGRERRSGKEGEGSKGRWKGRKGGKEEEVGKRSELEKSLAHIGSVIWLSRWLSRRRRWGRIGEQLRQIRGRVVTTNLLLVHYSQRERLLRHLTIINLLLHCTLREPEKVSV